ncbi:MAG: TrkH family potassium uptake protein [Christensenellaceae bacterium]|jgi:trk system potassium uptake protein TrkH
MSIANKKKGLSPAQVLVFGFGGMIAIGTLLLLLPIATKTGEPLSFVDALFTSTSAVCVTGLGVFDLGQMLSPFGQVTMLCLIQMGGIGFMTMTSMVYMLFGKRFTLKDRMLMQNSMNGYSIQGVVRMARDVIVLTAVIELAAFLIFAIRFVPLYGTQTGLYFSLFQSVSSFCNAGFDVFGMGTSLQPFATDPLIMTTTMCLITLGGLGFYVLLDIFFKLRNKGHRFMLHTKVVLLMSLVLTLVGFVLFLFFEWGNPKTFSIEAFNVGDKVSGAFFQSVTARTAGFAGVVQADLMPTSKILTIILMFIGASPAGTAGGIKTTTIALAALFLIATIQGKEDIEIFGRRIDRQIVMRALATLMLGILFVIIATIIVAVVEFGRIQIADIVFEIVSAFGTVGIASGNTAAFSAISRVVLVVTMYGGRVGIFTFTMAIAARMEKTKIAKRYPEDKIMIG